MCVSVPQVIGIGECETLVVTTIHFPEPVFRIHDIIKKVTIDNCTVVTNKVILDGTLEKNISFKTMKKDHCDDHGKRQVCGDLRHCTAFIPFECCIQVCGARPGDRCQIEFAGVEGEVDEPIHHDCDGNFKKLLEKTCIRVIVKVLRDTQITITPNFPSVCPTLEGACPDEDLEPEQAFRDKNTVVLPSDPFNTKVVRKSGSCCH